MIRELSRKLHAGEITSAELTEQYIRKIEEVNPKLNAYVHLLYDRAREDAARADEMLRAGRGGLLCGIPYALKSNICTEGIVTDCCSEMLEDYKPIYSSTIVEKLKNEGAVLLGKTNMDEFAMGSTSESSVYGAPKNPADIRYSTGGSSGGSAAAVAADLAVFAIGSDTGGSVRQPAALCGVTGFSPSYGYVSRYGLIAYASSFDTIGILSASPEDAGIVFDAIKGKDEKDATSIDYENDLKVSGAPPKSDKKLAILSDFSEKTKELLKQYEVETEEVRISTLSLALPAYYIIACAECSSNLGRYDGVRYGHRAKKFSDVDDMMIKSRSEGFGREVKKRIMLGTFVLQAGFYDDYYKKACMVREKLSAAFSEIFEKYDYIALPTAPDGHIRLGEKPDALKMYMGDIATVPANLAGLPAVSVNAGKDENGMPLGLQIMAARGKDNELLKLAQKFSKGGRL